MSLVRTLHLFPQHEPWIPPYSESPQRPAWEGSSHHCILYTGIWSGSIDFWRKGTDPNALETISAFREAPISDSDPEDGDHKDKFNPSRKPVSQSRPDSWLTGALPARGINQIQLYLQRIIRLRLRKGAEKTPKYIVIFTRKRKASSLRISPQAGRVMQVRAQNYLPRRMPGGKINISPHTLHNYAAVRVWNNTSEKARVWVGKCESCLSWNHSCWHLVRRTHIIRQSAPHLPPSSTLVYCINRNDAMPAVQHMYTSMGMVGKVAFLCIDHSE